LVFQFVNESLCRPYPFLSPSAWDEAEALEQLLTFGVQCVDGTMHLMQHEVAEKVFDAQGKRGFGIALLTVCFVDEDSQTGALVEAVVVVDVDAADGLPTFAQVDHQTELLVAEQVIVAQKELLNLESGVGYMRSTYPPNVAIVLPKENLSGIFGLGTTKRYRVIFDEHFIQFFEITRFSCRLAHNLIDIAR